MPINLAGKTAYGALPLCMCLTAAVSWYLFRVKTSVKNPAMGVYHGISTTVNQHPEEPSDYHCIQSLPHFHVEQEEPLKLNPWKPKSYLTFGIQNMTFSEYLPLDRSMSDRLALRRKIVSEHEEVVIGAMADAGPAIREFYKWLIGIYLPDRYPSIYKRSPARSQSSEPQNFITCSVDNAIIPLEPPHNSQDILRILAENIDAEFFFLKARKQHGNTTYEARAFVDCYPFAFDPRHKIGRNMAAIHAPVPGFKEKLQRSMDRYFASLPRGRIIKRHNWNVALDNNLYSPEPNPLSVFPFFVLKSAKWIMEVLLRSGLPALKAEDLDPDKVTVRCERQTLHRLKENADTLIFTFKTYQYTLRQLKNEGLGQELAEAICGQNYSVKEMEWYKGTVYWRDAVVAYLRA